MLFSKSRLYERRLFKKEKQDNLHLVLRKINLLAKIAYEKNYDEKDEFMKEAISDFYEESLDFQDTEYTLKKLCVTWGYEYAAMLYDPEMSETEEDELLFLAIKHDRRLFFLKFYEDMKEIYDFAKDLFMLNMYYDSIVMDRPEIADMLKVKPDPSAALGKICEVINPSLRMINYFLSKEDNLRLVKPLKYLKENKEMGVYKFLKKFS